MRAWLGAALALLLTTAPLHADTLVDHVNGITSDGHGNTERFSALLIGDDGRVVQLFHDGERRPRSDFLTDGRGAVMLPGFVDAHVRLMDLGFAALTLDLSGTRSLAEAQARVAAYVAAHGDRAWVLGYGWDARAWGAAPTAAELDAAVGDRPAWLISRDGGAGWANSRAMALAGVVRAKAKVAAARPAGVFTGAAMAQIAHLVPPPRPEDRDLAFTTAQAMLLKAGITTVADMGTTIEDWQAYRRAGDEGRLSIRIFAYARGNEAMALIAGPRPTPWLYDDHLRMAGVNLIADDAAGQPLLTDIQLKNLMSRAALDHFQPAVSANGPAAQAMVRAAVGDLAETYTGERRWRLENGSGVVVLGGAGDVPALASYAPAAPPAPFSQLAAAMAGGMSERAALAAATIGGAIAGFAEGRIGRLAPGMRADFVLVDRDPLAGGDVSTTRVLQVWVGGRRMVLDGG